LVQELRLFVEETLAARLNCSFSCEMTLPAELIEGDGTLSAEFALGGVATT
jgi:hypothetical protein